MGANWQADKAKTDKVLPVVKRILGEYLISAAPLEEDAARNTDLIVLRLEAVRIAVRIRSASYFNNPAHPEYRTQFTIRSGRPNGTKTELTKIIEGWGDYFFYGFATSDYSDLLAYVLGDLRVFRGWYARTSLRAKKPAGIPCSNSDGSSDFYAFNLSELPDEFIVAATIPINTTRLAA